ncbi:MAG: hypothetical protein ABGY72_24185 [bacterium]
MRDALRASVVFGIAAAGLVAVAACGTQAPGTGSEPTPEGVPGDARSISGVVRNGERGEAGVWVIAETDSLPTHFQRIVVTDDQGRFLVPDLPDADYEVWVRGYGLQDSSRVLASPGDQLTLAATDARTPQEAAKIYPANYWLSLYEPPAADALPLVGNRHRQAASAGEGQDDAGELLEDEESSEAAGAFPTRAHWLGQMKLSCMLCHQMGQEISRLWLEPDAWDVVWDRAGMGRTADTLGREVLKDSLSDWSSRIAAGEVPPAPPRPAGVERNIVITQWAWGQELSYIHDNVSTDKRDPTLYPDGMVWGIDIGQSYLWGLDPLTHTVTSHEVPMRVGQAREPARLGRIQGNTSSHNPMLDDQGNVWLTTRMRGRETPTWAHDVVVDTDGGASRRLSDRDMGSGRQLGYFNTEREEFVLVDTAYGTHHLQFDSQGRLWTSGDRSRLGMLDPSKLDPERPDETEAAAQTAWTKIDPATGRSVMGGGYGIVVNPVDDTIWRAGYPGIFGQPPLPNLVGNRIDMFDPKTKTYEQYVLPPPAYGPRGIDATTDGTLWFGTGSGHLGKFDRTTKEFTYWETPGPKIQGTDEATGSADFHYYIWVDQFDTFGLGADQVILTGTNSDSLLAFNPATELFTKIRIPYPLGTFTRGLDGRIDDPDAGWKGRGLWVSNNTDGLLHTENRMGYISQIQLRPNPLAP